MLQIKLHLKMSSSLIEIHENTKMGRESALLGDYETSLVYYQGVLQQMNRFIGTLKDPGGRQRWLKVVKILTLIQLQIYCILQFC